MVDRPCDGDDWKSPIPAAPLSAAWFTEIDQRFLYGARLFATDVAPFDRLIPFERLEGRRVLEIGCGMGLHTELMVRAGARVTSVDLSSRSVEATRRRLALKGLTATVMQADAEHLPFASCSFDFIWSWGVIHHSSRTALIVRRISEVLMPQGEARVMVYNREGAAAWRVFVWDYLLRAGFRKRCFDEQLWVVSDGFSARFYVEDQLADLFRAFFHSVAVKVCGQESDVLPDFRRLAPACSIADFAGPPGALAGTQRRLPVCVCDWAILMTFDLLFSRKPCARRAGNRSTFALRRPFLGETLARMMFGRTPGCE